MTGEVWFGCEVPDGLLYDVERHVWVRTEDDGTVVVGMTDVAQTMSGKVVQITWKAPGRVVARGRPLAVVESAKWVGPFPAPLSGEILATNEEAFRRDVLVANRDPYGAGWMVRLRPSDPRAEMADLVDAGTAMARYRTFIEANDIRCFRCED